MRQEAHIVQHKIHDIKNQISASLNNQISNIRFFGQISDRKCESVVQQRLGPEGSDSALLEEY